MERIYRHSAVAYPALWLVAVVLGCLNFSLAAAASLEDDGPPVGERVRQAMQDRDYEAALKAIDEAAQAEGALKEYLEYLKGRTLFLQQQYDRAIQVLSAMEANHPASPWARRARFARALALARKGDFRGAEMLYRQEAEYLLSADRKQEIADIYLQFADAFFRPPGADQKPDYQKALEFYQKALEVGPKPDKRIEVELLAAQCQQELGKPAEAANLYAKFIQEHPKSPLDIEARFRLGECRLSEGNLKEARRAWQDLLAEYPDSQSDRIPQAAFQLSRTWGIPEPASDHDLSLGVAALTAMIERFPTHELASQAYLDIARSYLHCERFDDAARTLVQFLAEERYQTREEVPEARNLLGRAYQLQKKFPDALATWREYLSRHPTHEAWSAVQQEIINTEHLMAQERFEASEYDEARRLWGEFVAKYPLEDRNPEIFYLFGEMHYRQDKWEAALADWRRLVSKYPNTHPASRGQFMIAFTLERKLGKLEEALEEYRKVTWGSHQEQARRAVARLTAKILRVATERVFRSDETPKLRLTTRNIESVSVRAYKIDLETYFRKMHLARGVEALDVALIDPDAAFEFQVPGYAKYQELQSTIEVPLPGGAKAGVMAVTVASKTLEATTLVVQSDLDVIVKSSRDEVFVFAQNMLTGKPWPGVKILISNGREVFAEAATGDDGVFQRAYKDLAEAGDVRVFAIAAGSVASNVIDLEGVGVGKGLADKGYIYTDRPAYRAGQVVHVRGCIRQVPGARPAEAAPDLNLAPSGLGPANEGEMAREAYLVEAGKKFTVEVFDSRDRPVWQEEVALGPFGTFHLHFLLPPTSPQGQYRVLARDAEGRSYQGAFLVLEYQLEPVQLVVDTPRHVYYRGEEIEGTIRASFYYGAPVAGREVRYQLADDRLHSATTDEKGEVRFKLPTREFQETQILPLVVILPERNLQAAVNFLLASQGFSISVSTVRPVYMAGESFEVRLSTVDAEGKPVAQKVVLSVVEKTVVDGKVGERVVETHELQTAETDGSARQTLVLKQGGRYVLRAEGTDRFKNPIWGESLVRISGDEDQVRLRILADQHTYKVGDVARLRLHWREEPALALMTFQGARVLGYKLVELQKGDNPLELPMTAQLAPNFELAVAVMTDVRDQGAKSPHPGPLPEGEEVERRRFHTASSPFLVERDLRVNLAAKRKGETQGPIRPGDQIEVTVTTTDPQGKPVAAEVSLAMVEKSLLERFAWPLAPIEDFFRGEPRQPAVRTTSSITFAYRPRTQPINPQLLAERERREIAAEEQASLAEVRTSLEPALEAAGVADTREELVREHAARAGVNALADFDADFEVAWGQAEQSGVPSYPVADLAYPTAEVWQELARKRSGGGTMGPAFSGRPGGAPGSGAFGGFSADGIVALGMPATGKPPVAKGQPLAAGAAGRDLYFGQLEAGLGQMPGMVTNGSQITNWSMLSAGDAVVLDAGGVAQIVQVEFLPGTDILVLRGRKDHTGAAQALIKQVEQLAGPGAVLFPSLGLHETGYWNPSVVTGDDGKASVTFTMPERSTAWKLLAKGITAETLAGEASEELVVRKDLFGELKLPPAFTDGDQAEVIASVHNDAIQVGKIDVTLKTSIAGRTVEETKTIDVKGKGIQEVVFKVALNRPEAPADEPGAASAELSALFELTVACQAAEGQAAGARDVVRQAVPLRPYGMPVYATASGSAESDTTAWVESPKAMPLAQPSLEILVGPTVERSLLDIVLGPAPACQIEIGRIASGLESATSDVMASLGLQKLLGATREAGGPQAQSLDGRIRASLSLLVSSQNDDGGWSWTGRGGPTDRYSTARVVWAMSLARAAGYTVPDDAYTKALGYLRDQLTRIEHSDYESQAIVLFALSAAGQGDFAVANRLYRSRPALSSAAIVYLSLAFAAMDRKATAEELLGLLSQRDLDQPISRRRQEQGLLPWSGASTELRALYALALQEVTPGSPKAREQVDWLLAHRTGLRWAPDKATGPAAIALCRWFAQSRFEGEHYQLTVFVNDFKVKTLDVDQAAATQAIEVPARFLAEGKQRINFQLTGRGRYTYQCVLGGFVSADKLASTTADWEVARTYEPAPLEWDGREIPRGFDVLEGAYSTFRNPLTELPVGRRGLVELHVRRTGVAANTPEEQLEYLVITEPIPSGATVIENSVQGGFERFEVAPGAITFYVGSRRSVGPIRYELRGYLPGAYRAAPTVVRDAYRPEQLAVAEAKPLGVLPTGAATSDAYRLTPRELLELGKRHFAKGDRQAAGKHLAELVENWNLKPEVYKEAVETLLDVHLELGPAAKVVHYFEIVKEKWPDKEIPFEKIVKVGAAYHEMGEYERSYLVFRATVESSFRRESGVAGFLESQGEFLRSVEVMGRLLREYPPESYLAAATYALAQRVYAKAPEAAADAKLRAAKINRVDLVRRAWNMLENFLTAYPDDPAADQASFAAANALLELEAHEQAIAACNRYAERYPNSPLLDSFWYIIGYCHFATGQHAKALEMCRRVAEARRLDPRTGREEESPNKWRAVYILGQVHHSLGEAADAIREYQRVADRFPDAKEAIDYFVRKAIALEEVTTVRPGEPVEVELKFRNIAACDAKVYRIDLMKFSLLKRSLGEITQINLAGIRPYHEATVELGDGRDYRDRTRKLPLPLKEEGAYLVVCRGENLYTSGLVLVTPLAVEVQEDANSGRVRTTVKDAAGDQYLANVEVKVIGSLNAEFISGQTDLRGVFVADGVQGTSTVIAQAPPSRYAFFRGQTPLAMPIPADAAARKPAEGAAPAPAAQEPPALQPAAPQAEARPGISEQLLQGLQETNAGLQTQQVEQLKQMYQGGFGGVPASQAF